MANKKNTAVVRDIQKAEQTPEHTYDDTRSMKPEMLRFFGDAFSNYVKSSGAGEKDLTPLSDAVKKMKDKFLAEQPVASKKDDHMNQLVRWAHSQGYTSSDIRGVMQEYQIADVTEDVNKYLKQSSADAGEKTRLMTEQGYKIDPLAANDDMAIAAFQKEMSRGYVEDALTKQYATLSEEDPGLAEGTLKELSRSKIDGLSKQLSRAVRDAGGSSTLTRQQIMDFTATRVQELIKQGLPEWYATYVVGIATYPYKRMADSAGEEREKATKSLENYEANLSAQATHDFLNQNILGANMSNRDMAIFSKNMGAENLALLLNAAEGDVKKNFLLGRFDNSNVSSWQSLVEKDPFAVAETSKLSFKIDNAWTNLLREGAPETQQSITNLGLGMKSTIPQVSQTAINKGQSAMNAAKMYNAAPDSSVASDKAAHNPIEERKMIQPTLAANAVEEVRVFGPDKIVYVNSYGNATLHDLDLTPASASREQERELRRIETMMTKMQRQTEEPMSKLAELHNDLAERAHGKTAEAPKTDEGTPEWEAMTPEQQVAEANRGNEEAKKTPPVPPRKPIEIAGSDISAAEAAKTVAKVLPKKLPTIADLIGGLRQLSK